MIGRPALAIFFRIYNNDSIWISFNAKINYSVKNTNRMRLLVTCDS